MEKVGRPSKYEAYVKPKFKDIKKWVEEGLPEKEIAERLGVNSKVFIKYKNEHQELSDLIHNCVKKKVEKGNNTWLVYCHTFPNGKVYIGITGQKPTVRWANGKGYSKNSSVRDAIDKYGWENVKHEILFENLTEKEAKAKEIQLIKKYDANDPLYGYNITCGGQGRTLTPEQKRRNNLRRRTFGAVMVASGIEDVLDNLDIVQQLSEEGTPKDEIANLLGVSKSTWYAWESKEPIIKEAIELGRLTAVKKLKDSLFKRATGFHYSDKKTVIEYEEFNPEIKDALVGLGYDIEKIGQRKLVRVEISEKYALPDPTSAMMLLKHWDKDDEGNSLWTSDPAMLELKKQELELKKDTLEKGQW